MGPIQTFGEFLNFLSRRLWLITVVTVIFIALATAYAIRRPNTYRAYASIEVQGAQVIGGEMPAGGTTTGSTHLMQTIEQRLTTRQNLAAIIQRHGLYADLAALSEDTKVALLRSAITFQMIEVKGDPAYGQPSQLSGIVIGVAFDDAENAARIANDLAQGVLDMSTSGQIERARDTYEFYLGELNGLTTQITAQEAAIADYKLANAETLPPASESNQFELSSIEGEIRALDQQTIAVAEEKRQISRREVIRATEQQRLKELDEQIAVMNEQRAALERRRVELQALLALRPEAERGLADLQRVLGQTQRSHDDANQRLTEAESALRLAERQQGERFAILDRAVTPESPDGPSRRLYLIAGALAGVVAGAILGFILDLLRPVIRTSAQMERELGLRPVIAIPELDFRDIAPPPHTPVGPDRQLTRSG